LGKFQTRPLTSELRESWGQERGLGSNFINRLPSDTTIITLDDAAAVFAEPVTGNAQKVHILVRKQCRGKYWKVKHKQPGFGQRVVTHAFDQLLTGTVKTLVLEVAAQGTDRSRLKKIMGHLQKISIKCGPTDSDV
jgi:hypothetical protein